MHEFVENFYTADRMAIVGIGVDHDHLVDLSSTFKPKPSSGINPPKAKYAGGKTFVNFTHILLDNLRMHRVPCDTIDAGVVVYRFSYVCVGGCINMCLVVCWP